MAQSNKKAVLNSKNQALIMAACCSAFAALAHLGCIIFGANWYRFFGAGEPKAVLADQGHWYPTMVTSALIIVLSIFSLYALSGANLIRKLPLVRPVLMVISFIFLVRGLAFFWLMPVFPNNSLTFWLVSSSICLAIGLLFAVGTFQTWSNMGSKSV